MANGMAISPANGITAQKGQCQLFDMIAVAQPPTPRKVSGANDNWPVHPVSTMIDNDTNADYRFSINSFGGGRGSDPSGVELGIHHHF